MINSINSQTQSPYDPTLTLLSTYPILCLLILACFYTLISDSVLQTSSYSYLTAFLCMVLLTSSSL